MKKMNAYPVLFSVMAMITLALAGMAAAELEPPSEGMIICDYLLNDLNIAGKEVPPYIGYKNEVFNLYTKHGDTIGHITLEDGVVAASDCTLTENPTFSIYIKDKQAVQGIMNADKPLRELNRAISHKDIIIKGESGGKKVKGFFTKLFIGIGSWFA